MRGSAVSDRVAAPFAVRAGYELLCSCFRKVLACAFSQLNVLTLFFHHSHPGGSRVGCKKKGFLSARKKNCFSDFIKKCFLFRWSKTFAVAEARRRRRKKGIVFVVSSYGFWEIFGYQRRMQAKEDGLFFLRSCKAVWSLASTVAGREAPLRSTIQKFLKSK